MKRIFGMSHMKRFFVIAYLALIKFFPRSSYRRAEWLRKKGIFAHMGENCFWQPLIIPSFPHLISFGNNVTVAGGVIFYEHDPIDRMWRCNKAYRGPNIPTYLGKVVVDDNVVIGGKSIILYDVHIGNDCVIGAGAVVTKDVPSFSIVAGNPARIIGDTRDLLRKRLSSIGIEFNENEFKYENYFN